MGERGRPKHPDVLTPRQFEVLELVREGLTNPQIAERLGISPDGAKWHVKEILWKLDVPSREEAGRWQREPAPMARLRLGGSCHPRRRLRDLRAEHSWRFTSSEMRTGKILRRLRMTEPGSVGRCRRWTQLGIHAVRRTACRLQASGRRRIGDGRSRACGGMPLRGRGRCRISQALS